MSRVSVQKTNLVPLLCIKMHISSHKSNRSLLSPLKYEHITRTPYTLLPFCLQIWHSKYWNIYIWFPAYQTLAMVDLTSRQCDPLQTRQILWSSIRLPVLLPDNPPLRGHLISATYESAGQFCGLEHWEHPAVSGLSTWRNNFICTRYHIKLLVISSKVLSSFMTYHRVCTYINTTGATSGAGTAYPSGAPEFTPGFLWGSCYSIFSFMCTFCRSLFVLMYFFFWPVCCLFFFEIRILITPLWSSNSS